MIPEIFVRQRGGEMCNRTLNTTIRHWQPPRTAKSLTGKKDDGGHRPQGRERQGHHFHEVKYRYRNEDDKRG